ncbi:MAG TPA: DUF971 domain-containing protein [Planctomycetaceae bacterium]|nr:DUF971 domain-containing protein [Planctomycetaceae bacterium]
MIWLFHAACIRRGFTTKMAFSPRSLKNTGDSLEIAWSDGVTQRISWRKLRDACPCASCRVERAQSPKPQPLLAVLSPAEARPLAPVSMRPAGNYAYAIAFSDGHNSGIYSLELLRQLGEESTRS